MGKFAISAAGVKSKCAVKVMNHYPQDKGTTINMSLESAIELASNILLVAKKNANERLKPVVTLAIQGNGHSLSVLRNKSKR